MLDGIAPAPVPQIEVTFNIDANGIPSVPTTLRIKGQAKSSRSPHPKLWQHEQGRYRESTERSQLHADEDKKKREAIDAKNRLENAIYQAKENAHEFRTRSRATTRRR